MGLFSVYDNTVLSPDRPYCPSITSSISPSLPFHLHFHCNQTPAPCSLVAKEKLMATSTDGHSECFQRSASLKLFSAKTC